MGSCPWLGVQVFFQGAIELAGKVPSAAWLETVSGGAGYNLMVDFCQKSVSAACGTSRPPGPGVCAPWEDRKLFFKNLGTILAVFTDVN